MGYILIHPQYELFVDKYAHSRRREPEFVCKTFFGQVLRFLVVDIDMSSSRRHDIESGKFIYAAIHEANISEPANQRCPINYYQNLGRTELVNLNMVQCLIGRIKDRNRWALVDRNPSQAKSTCS